MKDKITTQKLPSKWLRILIPFTLIVVWFVISGVGGPYFGRIEEVSSNDQTSFLPKSAESTKVQNEIQNFRSSTELPGIIVFESSRGEIDSAAIASVAERFALLEDVNDEVSPPIVSEDKQAAFVVVNIAGDAELPEVTAEIRTLLEENPINDTSAYITGAAGFSSDLFTAFSGIDGILLLVALSVVFVILIAVYRSPLLPILVLMTSLFALTGSILLVWNLANAGILTLNGQVQGILFILVIGAATDYSLLYVARYREELHRHDNKWHASIAALKGSIEPILASGGTVIVGLLCLLFSDLASNKSLGPVGAIGIAMGMLSALTFLPAILYACGRNSFWPLRPKFESNYHGSEVSSDGKGVWYRVGRFVARSPRKIWITTTVVLIVASFGIVQLKADGVAQSELILGYSEAREGQAVLSEHFPDGSGTPTYIIASAEKYIELVPVIEGTEGVDTVSVTSSDSPSGQKPLGKAAENISAQIEAGIPEGIPGRDQIVAAANPFASATARFENDRVLLNVTLDNAPDSQAAEQTIAPLRSNVQAIDGSAIVGGTTATALDTNTTSIRDRQIIIPIVLVAITLILMLLLRSLLMPLLLLATTVISFGAALGVSALVFNGLGFSGADPSVPLFGFVFLVALGIDYNIFLMTRVREESLKYSTKTGVIKGLVVTGGVITSAGVVLAATFAALAVIPVLFLAQLAFIVAFGVLLDTIIVRSLLVPAIVYDLGLKAWWPFTLKSDQ